MSPEDINKMLWVAKLFQFIAAIILTPEIIGVERFEKLGKKISSYNFAKQSDKYFVIVMLMAFVIGLPWIITDASLRYAIVTGAEWKPWGGRLFVGGVILLSILSYIILFRLSFFANVLQHILVVIAMFLRKSSRFRTLIIVLAVALFLIGSTIDLILAWPFK